MTNEGCVVTRSMVLVVDDNSVSRKLPSLVLEPFKSHVQVIECKSGYDGLMFLNKHPVTHVLLDISMPTLGGVDVLNAIKRTRPLRRLKLFAYTADALVADERCLRLIGFDDVLLKPLQRDRLLAVLGLSDLKVEV